MLRLVAYAPDGVRRFPVPRADLLIGSRPECDIYLPYTGVAQRHAMLSYDGRELRIEDLGSRRGLLVSGKKVRETLLEVLDEIRVGGVTLLVEDVAPEAEKRLSFPVALPPREPRMDARRMLSHLCRIGEWVVSDSASRITSEALLSDVLADFGGGVFFLLVGDLEQAGTKLVVASEHRWLTCGDELLDQLKARQASGAPASGGFFRGTLAEEEAWICHHSLHAVDRSYVLLCALPRFVEKDWSPLDSFRALGQFLILGLVHHVGLFEPILPGSKGQQQDLSLHPELVVGESPAMKRVMEELRGAIAPSVCVLLRGEAGVGKTRIANSLHRSGPRRDGPFIVASCAGGKAMQIEADLFGAEIPGRAGGLVRREGKFLLAHGGTLFLDDVDQLPLELQERLVRFLRSGEVEPAGSRTSEKVDVRVIAGSRSPLEAAVARDQFRVDLAYRLSQVTIEVPPLRERREDLPLLIQACINRFCHEATKRLQGITVKAMTALLRYDYPGNLVELENITRQMVYSCPAGRPADVNLLPERVREGNLQSLARVDSASDLDLEKLVGACEQAAIREALRRSHGNKSQAARVLGLSRNGLAIKMERLGLKG